MFVKCNPSYAIILLILQLKVFEKADGISVDTMLLLWSMKERFDFNSKYKVYFETLPQEFKTGILISIIDRFDSR